MVAARRRIENRASLRQTIPERTAYTAAWIRFWIWSFIRMFEMWFLTVFGLMCNSPAIIALSLPLAMSFNTWISRSESSVRIFSAMSGCAVVAETIRTELSDRDIQVLKL